MPMVEEFRDPEIDMIVRACPIRRHGARCIPTMRTLEPSCSEKDAEGTA